MDTIKFLLIGAFFVGVLLFGLMNQKGGGRYNFTTFLDRLIPFVPAFSVPYLLLFPYVSFAGIALFTHPLAVMYYASMAFAMCSAALVWFLFPSKMARPQIKGVNVFKNIVSKIYQGDAHANAFPSSHVFTSLLTSFFLSAAFPAYAPLLWIIGCTIAISTVFIKQHFAVDVLAGILWAYAGVGVAHMFFA